MNDKAWEVLVIEDDAACATTLTRMLHRVLGFATEVRVTDSAPKAIALLQSGVKFRFILSDYDLAAGKGSDVLTYIRETMPEMVHRFLFVSGSGDIINWGAHYLSKPYTMDELRDKLIEMNANK